MPLPVSMEEWRGKSPVSPHEAATYEGACTYCVKGIIASISKETLDPWSAEGIMIKLGDKGSESATYHLYLRSSHHDWHVKKIGEALIHFRDSQLECIVGVNQKAGFTGRRIVNYLLLPLYLEAVIKRGVVVCYELLGQYAEAATQ